MTPTTVGETAWFLIGNLSGVGLVFLFTLLAVGFVDVRRAVREGTQLTGEGIERNKRREQS